jgi:hypothetical protein
MTDRGYQTPPASARGSKIRPSIGFMAPKTPTRPLHGKRPRDDDGEGRAAAISASDSDSDSLADFLDVQGLKQPQLAVNEASKKQSQRRTLPARSTRGSRKSYASLLEDDDKDVMGLDGDAVSMADLDMEGSSADEFDPFKLREEEERREAKRQRAMGKGKGKLGQKAI